MYFVTLRLWLLWVVGFLAVRSCLCCDWVVCFTRHCWLFVGLRLGLVLVFEIWFIYIGFVD